MTEPREEADLRAWLIDRFIGIGCEPGDIDVDAAFNDLGIGSRDAVVLSGELTELVGRQVSPVDFWEHPTISTLVAFLTDPGAAQQDQREHVEVHEGGDDAVAVVGIGCRFPGDVCGPDDYWSFLLGSGNGVTTVSADRWARFDDGRPQTAAALERTTRWGGYLSGVDEFDAEYFDISPSEADKMDPQQRLLLEVTQEALDNAGIPASSLRHSQTGVFAGSCAAEYGYLATSDLSEVDAWSGTGGALSIISNRLSYHYDLRGPSVTIDTACSSSLVAIHLACQSLRSGESTLALAAGVNVMLSPAITRSFDRADAMSQSGQCHSFDAAADGYVRGEGAGVVILKRLADAARDGDRVIAVVRGSAVNQDGHSNGLMAPNPAAQMAVLRSAYAAAGLTPRDVDYVEAHGTGTLLGDPIEARALGTVLGRGRPADDPLLVGAVKSNIGHLEAAAGVAGFIKAALAVERGVIPANLGFAQPNPHINTDSLRLRVVADHTEWPQRDRARRAGVSSFGFGGTNAHVVLEQAPRGPQPLPDPARSPVTTLTITGKSADRVRTEARSLAEWMEHSGQGVALADIAHTLDHHRTRHSTCATVTAVDHGQAVAGLRALAAGERAPGVVDVHDGRCRPGVVFVYSGQGSQWAGMARSLLATEPHFAAAVSDIEPDFVAQVGFSLIDVIRSGEPVVGIDRIQPVLTGLQLALTRLWAAYGVVPDAVIGHSMGEAAAAVVSGALTVADGLKVIATRSRLMAALSGQGAMALVELDALTAGELIVDHPDVTVAVHASPRQTVIAGPPDQVDAVITEVSSRDRLARRIEVDVASHHPIIDPVLPDLRIELADLSPRRPNIPFISTTQPQGDPGFDAEYWCANLRNPVHFSEAVTAAGADHGVFVEISPHPILTYAIDDTLSDVHHHAVATLHRDQDDALTFHTNLSAARPTAPAVVPHAPEPHVVLPPTVWHHASHWIDLPERSPSSGLAPAEGTLLGERIEVADATGTCLWRARLTPETKPYPGSHVLHGLEVVPVSVLIATLASAARDAGIAQLGDLAFAYPIAVDRPRVIHVVVVGDSLSISSSTGAEGARWVRHATARAIHRPPTPHTEALNGLVPDAAATTRSTAELLRDWGVTGQPFPWSFTSLARSSTRMRAEVSLPTPSVHAVLDAAAHVARLVDDSTRDLMVPAALDSVWLAEHCSARVASVDVRRNIESSGDLVVDISATAAEGPVLEIRGLRFSSVDSTAGAAADAAGSTAVGPAAPPSSMVHVLRWSAPDGDNPPLNVRPVGRVALVGDAALAAALGERLHSVGDGLTVGPVDGADDVIYLAPTASGDHTSAAVGAAAEVTELIGRLVQAGRAARLWVITSGVRSPRTRDSLPQSALWGLATVIAEEQPEHWGGLIDLPAGVTPAAVAEQIAARLAAPLRSISALVDDEWLVPTPVLVDAAPVRQTLRCRPDAAYLVTGGFGALGLVIADWLAGLGARRIILAGRHALPPRREWDSADLDTRVRHRIECIRALESRGVAVEPTALDVSDADAVRGLLGRRDDAGCPPVAGVVHAAGVTENHLVTDTDAVALHTVMQPKIGGAQALSDVFANSELDFFHVTGSAGALFGIPGQGGYAAANAYLDALARFDHAAGRHTLSIDWVAWQDLGFATDARIVVAELERFGSRPVRAEEAFAAWEYIARLDVAQAVVLPRIDAIPVAENHDDTPSASWEQMSRTEMMSTLENGLRAILAHELRIPEADLESDIPFAELGLNSVMAMSIRRDAEKLAGVELSATMLWNHPTIAALATHLADKIAPPTDVEDSLESETDGLLDSLFDDVESSSLPAEPGL
ncbi:type I polyketide synthase [Gordonia otitidis]|uniref:Polyketide synthase n=1 Tax=Gordonia otitidis (strain DSM 44809 / CCUG 52243 / JCM 12355 / NBRC 100426 / IFM 10032) TaxID=1108044 RepID=H5TH41_GORO1|nr:type I polyketide synthase [Gordonia otitidis]GAB32799.1 putative polyketide synthase [Gordonia otitidis NBRC 100426]